MKLSIFYIFAKKKVIKLKTKYRYYRWSFVYNIDVDRNIQNFLLLWIKGKVRYSFIYCFAFVDRIHLERRWMRLKTTLRWFLFHLKTIQHLQIPWVYYLLDTSFCWNLYLKIWYDIWETTGKSCQIGGQAISLCRFWFVTFTLIVLFGLN